MTGKKNKSLLIFAASYVTASFLMLFLFSAQPVSAAPIDDARKNACEKGVVDKKECENWFNDGYKEAKRLNETDQKKVCIAPKEFPRQ